jgi:glucose-1-phosphate cytidylyltransferase
MKVVILAGGYGTRISEESQFKPKPMIEIGGMPILWHIMKWYSHFGHNDFIICCGYKQQVIKDFFANYFLYNSDVTFDFTNGGRMTVHNEHTEDWRVTVVDTGLDTLTGGRLKKIRRFLNDGESFLMTYGDGVADVDINASIAFHQKSGTLATLTGVLPEGRFGVMDMEGERITSFPREKQNRHCYKHHGFWQCMDTMRDKEKLEKLLAENKAPWKVW